MLEENYEIYISHVAKNTFKLSTMVGENYEIYLSQVAKMHNNNKTTMYEITEFIASGHYKI